MIKILPGIPRLVNAESVEYFPGPFLIHEGGVVHPRGAKPPRRNPIIQLDRPRRVQFLYLFIKVFLDVECGWETFSNEGVFGGFV